MEGIKLKNYSRLRLAASLVIMRYIINIQPNLRISKFYLR